MSSTPAFAVEERVLVLAPTPGDATRCRTVLEEAGLRCQPCLDLEVLVKELRLGAGVLLLTEESLNDGTVGLLQAELRAQPDWSDIPVLVLSGRGADSPTALRAMELLGNVTILERPVRILVLVSTVNAALRARRRQYELRAHLSRLERTQERLQRSEERFRRLVDTAGEGMWEIDTEGRTTYLNQRMAEMLGYPPEELLGRRPGEFLLPGDAPMEGWAPGASRTEEWRLVRSDGAELWAWTASTPIRDASGAVIGGLAMVTDISRRKRAEDALREADRRKDEFLATLAHELRNPLAPLRNGIRILEQVGAQTPTARKTVRMMGRQITHMVRLIDDLLDVSRIARGKVQLALERCDLARIVGDTTADYRSTFESKGVELRVSVPGAPIWVNGDATRLAQALGNLLHNANKFTARGAGVEVRVALEAHEAVVTVADKGIGIEPALLERVFEPFAQADQGPARQTGGLGLGLALVKGLIERHDGAVRAQSGGPGLGATFEIRLPRLELPAMESGGAVAAIRRIGALPRHKILVVDDNQDSAASLAALLELIGHDVRTAGDGDEALAEAARFLPDVVLLDIGLPGISGLEVGRRIRSMSELHDALIIAQTGYGQQDDRRRTREAGFDHHLTKPVDLDELGRVLTEHRAVTASGRSAAPAPRGRSAS